ncbi:MAG TPA: GHKL domain-containing protein [Candidatus Choladousia intestinigallinarum]|nr:GHKL domain-containing protein [Candidatus Choladousia intestinigallinarum]
MKYEMAAELLLGLFANGIRFYAVKRFMDFFVSRDKCQWKYEWSLYILGCVGTYAVSLIFLSPGWKLIANILALLLLTVPYQVKLSKKLLMALSIYAVSALTDILVVQLLTGYESGKMVGGVYNLIVSLAFLLISAFLKRAGDYERDTPLPSYNMVVLGMIPLISVISIYLIDLLTDHSRLPVLAAAFGLIIINMLLFCLYQSLIKFYLAKINEKKLEQMTAMYAYQLEVVQESEEHIKELRHDMKHHILELSAMARQEEKGDMVQYLKQMEQFMLNPAEKVSTGNKEIDGVLNYMLRQADQQLNTVDLDIQIPKRMYSANFNICVILGNLLDNALREARGSQDKYLSVQMRTKSDVLLIFIENSYDGKIAMEEDTFKTTQKDKSLHGFGLESVKQIISACRGDMKIEYTENRFQVQVLLYLSNIL